MEEVKKKLNMADDKKLVIIIWGMGGIGKTTLGNHVYNSVVDKSKYSHCKLEMDVKSTDVPKLQFQLLNQVFEETEAVLNAEHGQGRIAKAIDKSSNQSKPLFLYIDNAIRERDVDSLLPTNSLSSLPQRSRIMVTTRNLNHVVKWRCIPGFEIAEFKMDETREGKKMLSYYVLGDENGSFDQDVDVDKLLDTCMGIPLIIQMAANNLTLLTERRDMDMSEACRNVTEHMQSLKKGEGWEDDDMDRMVDFVYGQLPKSSQRIFLDIVFFFIDCMRYLVVCIFGEIVIGELEGAALLSTNEEGRLKVHDIIKVRAHAISNGSRICDRDSWELVKKQPEKLNAIEGLGILVEENDMEYVSRCDKIRILILIQEKSAKPVKVHFPSSVEILILDGHFVHNENLANAFKAVAMCMNEFEQGFTSYQSFRQVKCLGLVQCKGIDIPACFSHALSSCKLLTLSDAEVELIPSGNNKVYYQLESLELDGCYKLRNLPDIFRQHCSSIKILSLRNCYTLKTLPSFELLKNLEKLDLFGCKSMETLCENFGSLSKLKELDMGSIMLEVLPPTFGLLKNLKRLNMYGCKRLESLCENIGSLSNLEELNINSCKSLQALPPSFGELKNLEKLGMRSCTSLRSLCENFGSLSKLKELDISSCENLQALPSTFGLQNNLKRLDMSRCTRLESLCENIGSLLNLEELNISSCGSLQSLPPSFGELKNLEQLNMSECTSLRSLCENFGSLSKLKLLNFQSCENLQVLPPTFGLLNNLKFLNMFECKRLESLCENIGSLSNLEELDISDCESLQALPPSFGELKNLKRLDMQRCTRLESLCENIGSLSKLKLFNFQSCENLQALPSTFGLLNNLERLDMYRCKRLESLCENIGSLSSLEELHISDCESLQALPPSFGELKNLKRLYMIGCKRLESLCENIGSLSKLKLFNFQSCESLQALPPSFGELKNLEKLYMGACPSLRSLCENFGSLSKLEVLDISDCESLQALPPSFGELKNLEKLHISCKSLESLREIFGGLSKLEELDISDCESLKTLCENFGSLLKLKYLTIRDGGSLQALPHSFGLPKNLERLSIFDCTMLEDLPEGLKDMHALRRLEIERCKNIKISVDNLPPVHVLSAVEIDAVDEKMVDDLLRLPTVLHLAISDNFDEHIESYARKYTPLPLINLVINDRVFPDDHLEVMKKSIAECLLCGGGGGEYWRVEGDDDDLVREEAQPDNNNVAFIITGLNPVSRKCREAVHRMAEEGYEIIYVDTGISRWKRYETAYQRQGRAFSGEVALNQDDMQMMKQMLKELLLPNEFVPRVWTSPFPKSCFTLAFHLYLSIHPYSFEASETLVLKRSSLEEAASAGQIFSTPVEYEESYDKEAASTGQRFSTEYEESYDKERSCESGEVALPSLGIQNISSKGLACFAAWWQEELSITSSV